MLSILVFSTLLSCILCAAGASPRPLVIWHGLGDSYASPGMLEFASMIQDLHPGIFIHSVYLEKDLDKDKQAGFVRMSCNRNTTVLSS